MITSSSCVRTFCPRVLRTAGLQTFTLRRRRLTTACSVSATKNKEKEKVIVVSGPTGSGKTRLALELAKRLNGEIISADSVQVYRGLDIGSAKPSPAERQAGAFQLDNVSLCILFSTGGATSSCWHTAPI